MLTYKGKRKRKRTSKIWKLPDDEFANLVKNSTNIKIVLNYFDMNNKGGNFRTVKARIHEMGLDTSHFLSNVDASNLSRRVSLQEFQEEWLIVNCDRSRGFVKKYLRQFNLIEYKCSDCQNDGNWNNKELVLQLEHINGISNDNRLENLCFLCPNCHSQTSSYAGKGNKINHLCVCGEIKGKISKFCIKCIKSGNVKTKKIDWPPLDELNKMLWEMPTTHIAKKLGVSDKAIEAHIKKRGLTKPPRGYWKKVIHNSII